MHCILSRIDAAENQQSKLYKEIKDQIKEKYKKKTDKALKDLKTTEDLRHQHEIDRIVEEERHKLASALQEQKELYENDIGSVSVLSQVLI